MILLAKMLEVCSTTLPQMILPYLYDAPEFKPYLASRITKYQKRAAQAVEQLNKVPNVRVAMPGGVFYLVVELLELPRSTLISKTKTIRLFIDNLLEEAEQQVNADFQFCYELMGAEGICVVPLSGFGSDLNGFRMTLLQEDDEVFTETLNALCRGIQQYYEHESIS